MSDPFPQRARSSPPRGSIQRLTPPRPGALALSAAWRGDVHRPPGALGDRPAPLGQTLVIAWEPICGTGDQPILGRAGGPDAFGTMPRAGARRRGPPGAGLRAGSLDQAPRLGAVRAPGWTGSDADD